MQQLGRGQGKSARYKPDGVWTRSTDMLTNTSVWETIIDRNWT